MPTHKPIAFIDLSSQQKTIRTHVDQAIKRVLDHGKYIMGPEVLQLEQELSDFCGAKHTITCSSGTDALLMILMAKGIGPGDAVILPSFTFTATPEVIALLGASPIFVDIKANSFNLDPAQIDEAVLIAKQHGLKPKGIMAVDLFGQPADYDTINTAAQKHDMWVLADAAQSFGASQGDQKVGQMAMATATSFFPAKPLGCYGDGGAIFTDDSELSETLRSIRVHGKGKHKYDNVRIGINGRLDTIQAAILLEKLKIFPHELKAKQRVSDYYHQQLSDLVTTPSLAPSSTSTWAQYTIILPDHVDREKLINSLKEDQIPTAVYYAKPLHKQIIYQNYPRSQSMEHADYLSERVLSLPMSAYIAEDVQDFICERLCYHLNVERDLA